MVAQMTVRTCAVLLLLGLGLYADATPSCDNRCRMRQKHKPCPTGRCHWYVYETCLGCTPGINALCVNTGWYAADCLPPLLGNPENAVNYYLNCTPKCSCTNASLVEADELTDLDGDPVGFAQVECQ